MTEYKHAEDVTGHKLSSFLPLPSHSSPHGTAHTKHINSDGRIDESMLAEEFFFLLMELERRREH